MNSQYLTELHVGAPDARVYQPTPGAIIFQWSGDYQYQEIFLSVHTDFPLIEHGVFISLKQPRSSGSIRIDQILARLTLTYGSIKVVHIAPIAGATAVNKVELMRNLDNYREHLFTWEAAIDIWTEVMAANQKPAARPPSPNSHQHNNTSSAAKEVRKDAWDTRRGTSLASLCVSVALILTLLCGQESSWGNKRKTAFFLYIRRRVRQGKRPAFVTRGKTFCRRNLKRIQLSEMKIMSSKKRQVATSKLKRRSNNIDLVAYFASRRP